MLHIEWLEDTKDGADYEVYQYGVVGSDENVDYVAGCAVAVDVARQTS